MNGDRIVVSVDIGAESGRMIALHFDGQRLRTEEVFRFPNVPVQVQNRLYWDILRLWNDVQTGFGKIDRPASIGIDFGLLDRAGNLLDNPFHYLDRRTEGMLDYVYSKVSREAVFKQTGTQSLSFNTLFQLASLVKAKSPMLENAERLLTVPDLLYYWMTGVILNEFTNATTTQCYDIGHGEWAFGLLDQLNIPTRLFRTVSDPGQILGTFNNISVVLTTQHDSASANLGVTVQNSPFAYLSSGTWSILGVQIPEPLINPAVLAADATN